MVVGSTPEDFKEKQSVFERSLSILLNSHVIVDKIEVVGSQQSNSARSRRAVDGQRYIFTLDKMSTGAASILHNILNIKPFITRTLRMYIS